MYCVIKCVKTKRVLKGNFASSVFHSCNAKTQKTQICVTGPQCVKLCLFLIFTSTQSNSISNDNIKTNSKNSVRTCAPHDLAWNLLVAAPWAEDLPTHTAMMTTPERRELLSTVITFLAHWIRHPILFEIRVLVCLQSLHKQHTWDSLCYTSTEHISTYDMACLCFTQSPCVVRLPRLARCSMCYFYFKRYVCPIYLTIWIYSCALTEHNTVWDMAGFWPKERKRKIQKKQEFSGQSVTWPLWMKTLMVLQCDSCATIQ
jgi:hypothetical protein